MTPVAPFQILVKRKTTSNLVRAWVVGKGSRITDGSFPFYGWIENPLMGCVPKFTRNPDGDVLLENEGLTWCRGWDGDAADALRATIALS